MKLLLQPRSIALRLIVAVLTVELVSSILVVALSFGYERHMHFRAFDVMLHGRADSILGAVQDAEDSGDNLMLDKDDLKIPPEDIYEVWDEGGHLLGRSANWQGAGPGAPAEPRGDILKLTIDDHHYRVLRVQGQRTVDPGKRGGKQRVVTILYGSPTSRVWHSIRGAVEFYAGGSVLLLLVTGPLIAWLLHRGLLPLRQLAALASDVSVDSWEFSPPASAYTTPELAPLTHALESVLQRLERSFTQQRAFVSDAAHELKTAVAVIKSSLQLLSMKPRSTKEYQTGLERCLADSQRLEALVADMLALARAESADATAGPAQAADVGECVSLVVGQLETVAAQREATVVRALGAGSVQVALAAEDLRLLLSNLLLNALQHSPAGSTIEIGFAVDAAQAVIVIRDHGDGIAAEALPHVFDRFYRGDPSRTRNTGGTGLGLAICRAIVIKAGGSIDIVSQPDQGTTVTVRLPVFSAA
jgi:signal transduction histidine kinase